MFRDLANKAVAEQKAWGDWGGRIAVSADDRPMELTLDPELLSGHQAFQYAHRLRFV